MSSTTGDQVMGGSNDAANKAAKSTEQFAKMGADSVNRAARNAEQMGRAGTEIIDKIGHTAEAINKDNATFVATGTEAAVIGFHEVTKAYQDIAARNTKRAIDAVQAMMAIKTAAEFFELQRRLVAEGMQAALGDFNQITKLSTAVFSSSFAPVQQRTEALRDSLTR